MQVIEYV